MSLTFSIALDEWDTLELAAKVVPVCLFNVQVSTVLQK